MSLDIEVRGAAQLYDLARRLQNADEHLSKELRRGLLRASRPLRKAVRAEIPPVMPKGYEPVLLRALRLGTRIGTGYFAHVQITAYAAGAKKGRDLRARERGSLRHPVFGRYRVSHKQRRFIPNPWVDQLIRPGFFSRPVRAGAPMVRRELVKVMADVADKITRG